MAYFIPLSKKVRSATRGGVAFLDGLWQIQSEAELSCLCYVLHILINFIFLSKKKKNIQDTITCNLLHYQDSLPS